MAQARIEHKQGKRATVAKIDTSRGYFSLTGEVWEASRRTSDPDYQWSTERNRGEVLTACGAMGDTLAGIFPRLAPLNALHLSSIDTGEPMHGSANGLHWLNGVLDPLGLGPVQYGPTDPGRHGLSTHTPEKCREYLAAHLRVDVGEVDTLTASIVDAWKAEGLNDPGAMAASIRKAGIAANLWAEYYAAQLPRFKREALAGLELIASL